MTRRQEVRAAKLVDQATEDVLVAFRRSNVAKYMNHSMVDALVRAAVRVTVETVLRELDEAGFIELMEYGGEL